MTYMQSIEPPGLIPPREHPTKGRVHFSAHNWGTLRPAGDGCMVCLAGMWYVHRQDRLLGEERKEKLGLWVTPRVADFLDRLRFPFTQSRNIERYLGVPRDEIVRYNPPGNVWESDSDTDILDFLGWLLTQNQKEITDDNN